MRIIDIKGEQCSVGPESNGLETPQKQTPEVETIHKDFPEYPWEFDAPENHGVDGALLEGLHGALPDEIRSVLIVKDGFIIDEY